MPSPTAFDWVSCMPTGEVVENGLPPAATRRMAEIEVSGRDFNSSPTSHVHRNRRRASARRPAGGSIEAAGTES